LTGEIIFFRTSSSSFGDGYAQSLRAFAPADFGPECRISKLPAFFMKGNAMRPRLAHRERREKGLLYDQRKHHHNNNDDTALTGRAHYFLLLQMDYIFRPWE